MIRCFFFFKQKTAYEMRISDWSPDVCSSDFRAFGPRRRCGHTSGFPPSRSTMNTNAELLKELRIDRKAAPPPSRRGLWISTEESRVGKESVRTCRSRWSAYHSTQKYTTYETLYHFTKTNRTKSSKQ